MEEYYDDFIPSRNSAESFKPKSYWDEMDKAAEKINTPKPQAYSNPTKEQKLSTQKKQAAPSGAIKETKSPDWIPTYDYSSSKPKAVSPLDYTYQSPSPSREYIPNRLELGRMSEPSTSYGATSLTSRNDNGIMDRISDTLVAASFIPGLDTFTNIASIPVDLLRGDYVGAGLSVLGAMPLVGEIADGVKTARAVDKLVDGAKAVDKGVDSIKAVDKGVDSIKAVDKGIETTKNISRSQKGNDLLSKAQNPKLQNTIKEMYRPGAQVGDGGLSDAIKFEKKNNMLVGGRSHIQKGKERARNLENILRKEILSDEDKDIICDLLIELYEALGGIE